jgi:hypothetical protein
MKSIDKFRALSCLVHGLLWVGYGMFFRLNSPYGKESVVACFGLGFLPALGLLAVKWRQGRFLGWLVCFVVIALYWALIDFSFFSLLFGGSISLVWILVAYKTSQRDS